MATRAELENALTMLAGDVRQYRDRAQARLNEPAIAFSDMLVTVGKIKALRDVLAVIEWLAELYKLDI